MIDSEGVRFLQWCLPKLRLRWPGFRKVRRQVYKRIDRRMKQLGLPDVAHYRTYLDTYQEEWSILEKLCWISIARFFRDKQVFQYLEEEVLPDLAQQAGSVAHAELRCWSIGCASGEEPYTVAILWRLRLAAKFPTLGLRILATDVDPQALQRAETGCYQHSSLKDLPADWLRVAFGVSAEGFRVKPEYRESVTFRQQDIRNSVSEESFHLILCRNLVFTYFDEELQRTTLREITKRLLSGGALVIDNTESLPEQLEELQPWDQKMGVYRKVG